MSVSADEVRRIARLARLGLDESEIPALAGELSSILSHMEVLARASPGAALVPASTPECTPLRPDTRDPIPLAVPLSEIVPESRDGFILVPRLATHEDDAEPSP